MGLVTLSMDGPDEPGFKNIITQGTITVNGVMTKMPFKKDELIMVSDPGPTCVSNGGTLGTTMVLMILFSVCVQMAEGLHYGIVPYISRPALGMVSGMVGAGGNLGAMLSSKWWVGARDLDFGFVKLGIIIMGGSLTMFGIFFPGEGGMILPASLGYDPQLIKPEEGQKGSDELDFSNAVTISKTESETEQKEVARA